MSTNDQYSLNWNNHTSHIKKAFDTLWSGNQFVDVTLSCEGKKISAHKMLLSACSIYFHDLFRDNPCQHPIVILRDVKFNNLVNILKFIYSGEVSVAMDCFDEFLKTAELLQISGLIDDETRSLISEKDRAKVHSSSSLKKAESPKQVPVSDTNTESLKQKESTRKRPSEINNVNDVSEKKIKDSEVCVDVKIKQEADEDDHFVEIKDPLDFEEDQHDTTETEFLPSAAAQKFVDVQELLNDKQSSTQSLSSIKGEGNVSFGTFLPSSVRYLPTSYPPLVITHVPTQIPSTKKNQSCIRYCRYCPGRRETMWQCVPCGNIPLHRESCFHIYHNELLNN